MKLCFKCHKCFILSPTQTFVNMTKAINKETERWGGWTLNHGQTVRARLWHLRAKGAIKHSGRHRIEMYWNRTECTVKEWRCSSRWILKNWGVVSRPFSEGKMPWSKRSCGAQMRPIFVVRTAPLLWHLQYFLIVPAGAQCRFNQTEWRRKVRFHTTPLCEDGPALNTRLYAQDNLLKTYYAI